MGCGVGVVGVVVVHETLVETCWCVVSCGSRLGELLVELCSGPPKKQQVWRRGSGSRQSQPSNQPTLLTMSTYQAPSPGWFDEFRTAPFPTLYPELKTSVTQDVLYVGWGVAFLSAFTAFCLILPGVERSLKEQVKVFLRVTTFLAVGLIIMLCNFGQEWEVGHIETRTAYKAGSAEEIHAAIGVKLGLRSVNITLK
ncbi:hypothetical protein Pcinc_018993, partial [Petrolisthes cinctipes]